MAASPTARARRADRAASELNPRWAGIALCVLALHCGGEAESGPRPGASLQAPALAEPGSATAPPASAPPPRKETCADNPLVSPCYDESVAPPSEPAAPPRVPAPPAPLPAFDAPNLAPVERAEIVLSNRCGSCHASCNTLQGVCGLTEIDDIRKMIRYGQIVPCRWTESKLYQRLGRGDMPPEGSGVTPPTAAELNAVADFVDGMCANLVNGGAADSERVAIESWLARDCASCHGSDAGAAPTALDGRDDIPELLEAGLIVPCNPEGSPLLQRLLDDSMPPPGTSGPRPTAAELRALRAFIQRPCSRR